MSAKAYFVKYFTKEVVVEIGDYIASHMGNMRAGELSYEISCSAVHVGDILKGDRKPSPKLLDRIAVVLKLNRFYLYYLAGRWPQEMRGLSQVDFQRQYGLGLEAEAKLPERQTREEVQGDLYAIA